MTTASPARAYARPLEPITATKSKRITEAALEGGFRKITTHQLVMIWHSYQSGLISRRQLRVWFALHEMLERRECAAKSDAENRRRAPTFSVEEVSGLVGGRGAERTYTALAADLRRLETVGLATMNQRRIDLAISVDQLHVSDLSGFRAMLAAIPNPGRSVPVPRRMLRALAGGFSKAVTAVIIATLIRSLFWHREKKTFAVDGRTKGSWIAETFSVSRRAVTDAKAHLVQLGWLQSIEAPQWQLNKWGAHDAINVEWSNNPAANNTNGIASPPAKITSENASPDLNNSPFPSEKDLETPNSVKPNLAGVSNNNSKTKSASSGSAEPDLRNVEAKHLENTDTLLTLYAQATTRGLIPNSEAGKLDFFACAERARARGGRPGALFMWLLKNPQKAAAFISQIDDERAAERLREHRNKRAGQGDRTSMRAPAQRDLTDDERFYLLCVKLGKQHRVDPFYAAKTSPKRWTREHFEIVKATCEAYDRSRWLA